jgi:hypothetical protein
MGMMRVVKRTELEVKTVDWNRRPPVLTLNFVSLNFDLGVNKTQD